MEKIIKIVTFGICVAAVFCAVKKTVSAIVSSVAAFKAVKMCKYCTCKAS